MIISWNIFLLLFVSATDTEKLFELPHALKILFIIVEAALDLLFSIELRSDDGLGFSTELSSFEIGDFWERILGDLNRRFAELSFRVEFVLKLTFSRIGEEVEELLVKTLERADIDEIDQ